MSEPTTILFAEDSRTQAELLRHLLQKAGYRVIAAGDGREALSLALRQIPALVLADVEMPVMGGYEMCRAFKDNPKLRPVPFMLLTSLSDANDVLRGLEAGADFYLTKPYEAAYLLSCVASVLHSFVPTDAGLRVEPLEIHHDGTRHLVTAGRRQILNLLLSTYGNAVQRNRELIHAQQQLYEKNRILQATVRAEQEAIQALKQAQAELIQKEKMASLGILAAGVAHEINNPLAFVLTNMEVLQRDVGALNELLSLYDSCHATEIPAYTAEIRDRIHDLSERIDLKYTLEHLPAVFASSRDGLERIRKIVAGIRNFARLDESDLNEVDLNQGIESTVAIIQQNATNKQVQIELQLGKLPRVPCYPAKINQVVLNLIDNAIDACTPHGKVTVLTRDEPAGVRIEVADTGCGIEPAIRDRIFDPFFTTKAVGQGTGLGLYISHRIIKDHGGSIEVESQPGQGSRFIIRLPHGRPTT